MQNKVHIKVLHYAVTLIFSSVNYTITCVYKSDHRGNKTWQ